MPASSYQTGMVGEKETHSDVLRDRKGVHPSRSCSVAEKEVITFQHVKSTDVLFVDIRPVEKGATITTLDVGAKLGFPGQVLARVDRDREMIYGLTIQNYSGFRRRLLWRYRMASMQRAIQLLIAAVRVGLCLDNRYHDRPVLQG